MYKGRTAKIISQSNQGFLVDGFGTIDSNPDRTTFEIQPLDCSKSEFIEWFLLLDNAGGFCTDGARLIDLGGSTLILNVDTIISISYQEIINAWLDFKAISAKADIGKKVQSSRKKLGLIE